MKKLINKVLKPIGYQIKKYQHEDPPRLKIINQFNINKLLDVGANVGQFSLYMRSIGFSKKIISFEPLKTAFEKLNVAASKDNNWIINNYALGNENTQTTINVSENSHSSSLLPMATEHINRAPASKYIGKEIIEVKKLDSVFGNFCDDGDNIMLKIDTQGYEKNVILGADNILNKIKVIQLEMSIIPLYENGPLFLEMISFLDSKGFELFYLENGFSDVTSGRLLQIDGIFINKQIAGKF